MRSLREDGQFIVIGFASGDIPKLPANHVLLRNRRVLIFSKGEEVTVTVGDFETASLIGKRYTEPRLVLFEGKVAFRPAIVNWQTTEAAKGDPVRAYAIDSKTGSLTFLNAVSCLPRFPSSKRGRTAITNFQTRSEPSPGNSSSSTHNACQLTRPWKIRIPSSPGRFIPMEP
jgi:hypothetical protein